MSNAILMFERGVVGFSGYSGTIAGSIANLANDYAGIVWSSDVSLGYASIVLDMGSDVLINTIALFGITGVTGAAPLVQIQANTEAQGSFGAPFWLSTPEPLFAGSEVLQNGKQAALWIAPSVSPPPVARYWHIIASGVGAGFTAARIVVGARLALQRNFSFGNAIGSRSFGRMEFNNRGVPLRRDGPKLRTRSLTFQHIYKDEVENGVAPYLQGAGNEVPLLLVTDIDPSPQRTRRMFFGPLVGDLSIIQRNAVGYQWQADLVSLF
jgi:hypothetical protein